MRNRFNIFFVLALSLLASTSALANNSVTLGETTSEGGLPSDSAAAIMKENLPDAVVCLGDGVEVPSFIKIELQLGPDQPIKARVLRATIKNRKKGRCLLEAAKKWPLSVKQRTVVTQQFDIAYEDEAKSASDKKDEDAKTSDASKSDAKADEKADAKKDANKDKATRKDKRKAKRDAKKDAKEEAAKDAASDEGEGEEAAKEDDSKEDADEKGSDTKSDDGDKEGEKDDEKEAPAPQGSIRLFRDIKLESSVTPAMINAKVGEQHAELLACYMAVVEEKPKAAGHLDVKYTIADGKVTEVEVLKSTSIKGDVFAQCSIEAVKKWEFEGGGVTVTQRFGFTPTKYFAGKAGLVVNLTDIEGPMPAASVIKVAVKKQRTLAKCFKSSVKGRKAPITIATADVVINAKGKTKPSDVKADPETKRNKLAKCLTRALKRFRFKKLKKGEEGETTAKFEMIYTPKRQAFKVKKPRFK